MSRPAQPPAEPTLEMRIARLEEIARELEREELELEEALGLFEEGIGHLRHAQVLLGTAELRIERLVADIDEVEPVPDE
jgi:exodeoxyribonuclease VII small subunit